MGKLLFSKTKKVFALLAVMVGLGAGQAVADTTIVGETDNTTEWWSAFSDYYVIAPNNTLTVEFVNYSNKAENWFNWLTVITTDAERGAGDYSEYVAMRADCYGWQGGLNTNDNSSGWFKVNVNNYDWSNFKDNLDGATVKLTLQRYEELVVLTHDVTTADGTKNFRHFFAMNCGDGSQTIRMFLSAQNAHIVIDNDKTNTSETTTEPVSGQLVGNLMNATPWWTAFTDSYILNPDESMSVRFKNYSSKVENWHNWVTFVTNDVERNDTGNGYTEYIALRADNWESIAATNTTITSNFNWSTFKDDMDGATIKLTVTRSGADVTVRHDITTANGDTYFEETTKACGDGTQALRVFVVPECSHLDVPPETVTIDTYGWATFSSECALDFANAQEGLTAYTVTGHDGNTVTLSEVIGIVPAGTGLLLKGEAGTYTIPVATSTTAAPTNKLVGVTGTNETVSKEANMTKYVLAVNANNKAEFQKIEGTNATVEAGKAYLVFDGEALSRVLTFNGEATGIQNVSLTAGDDAAIYSLNGQRVSKATKGVYVKNGKKIIIK